jgi:hypothetical protein
MSAGSRKKEGSMVSINKQLWKRDRCDLLDRPRRDDGLVGVQERQEHGDQSAGMESVDNVVAR